MKRLFKHIVLGLISALIFSSCSSSAPTMSPKQEAALGEQEARKVLGQVRLSKHPQANAALRSVGSNIARAANRPDYRWAFYLVDNKKQANAFCLPGGKVFVYTGLFKYAASKDELAVVVAHEVAHALKSHGVKGAQRQQTAGLLGIALQVGMGIGGVDSQTAREVNKVYNQGATLGYIRPYSRENEYEADAIGLLLMARAGYDPRAALTFWNKFGKQGQRVPEYLSTHPAAANRIANIRKMMPKALALYKQNRYARRK